MHSCVGRYVTMRRHMFPSKVPLAIRDLEPNQHMVFGPTWVSLPKQHLDRFQPFLHSSPNQQTHVRYLSNRRCGLIIMLSWRCRAKRADPVFCQVSLFGRPPASLCLRRRHVIILPTKIWQFAVISESSSAVACMPPTLALITAAVDCAS